MTINQLIAEIHDNARKHGWWDDDRDPQEVAALINSEWAEALEEYRAGRPMLWRTCTASLGASVDCHGDADDLKICTRENCPHTAQGNKPEGIAVELIDGCIRILDWFGLVGFSQPEDWTLDTAMSRALATWQGWGEEIAEELDKKPPVFVEKLFYVTSNAFCMPPRDAELMGVVAMVCLYLKEKGIDAEMVMLKKMAYNVSRPYKHGKIC